MLFRDRADAGRQLAARLEHLRAQEAVVLGLPRGGVPVAAQVAAALAAPLDVVVVRKLGVPGHRELAMGAIGEDGAAVHSPDVVRRAGVAPAALEEVEARERAELDRRVRRLRAVAPRLPLAGRTAIVVDDGVATGATARAACAVVRALGAVRVVLAAPVCATDAVRRLTAEGVEVVSVATPRPFGAVSAHYAHFGQVPDEEVVALLRAARQEAE
ncbi:phosphoribosyltransferase [Modestobacter sp. I12A-02662]|uniref:phosphoribosyltransferase n=1 Tax=Modestobacter sp. I12A-02662 TaxID=1730496 RepID=UPI0034DF2529